MNKLEKDLLFEISGIHDIPQGAYNIRKDGELLSRNTTDDIDIISKSDKSGIDIRVKDNVVNKSIHIPVIITKAGVIDLVYNDFFIGQNCDITIVAGCGIHSEGEQKSQHDGIHTFYIGKNSKVRYYENHLGNGKGKQKVLNPTTMIEMDENSLCEMKTIQLKGVSASCRKMRAKLSKNCVLTVDERILTEDEQIATTEFEIELNGEDSRANLVSKSVAKNNSKQAFLSSVIGNSKCFAHVECDAITMDNSSVSSTPKILANSSESNLVHEAVIGKIAGEQVVKLMTLGLTEQQAEEKIVEGFLK